MKKFIENLSDATLKTIVGVTGIALTMLNFAFAHDIGEFYSHYFAGVMSAVALFIIFDDDDSGGN